MQSGVYDNTEWVVIQDVLFENFKRKFKKKCVPLYNKSLRYIEEHSKETVGVQKVM